MGESDTHAQNLPNHGLLQPNGFETVPLEEAQDDMLWKAKGFVHPGAPLFKSLPLRDSLWGQGKGRAGHLRSRDGSGIHMGPSSGKQDQKGHCKYVWQRASDWGLCLPSCVCIQEAVEPSQFEGPHPEPP